ncbi:hypothetical protein [Culicoidibacter larvae]|uniref:Uncharacterized protein n=1 Tax=Culicoidibacter larvae TaxID=2579976 RepID=A0A5R8Q7G0_9FIRM|nr:hypothetical protein [Culicoidibacter larvae]TLG71387.1 hypothetical protein FEZ08_10860 [Culicoidibacter larvae]
MAQVINKVKLNNYWHGEVLFELKRRYKLQQFVEAFAKDFSAPFLSSIWYSSSSPGLSTVEKLANSLGLEFPGEESFRMQTKQKKVLAPREPSVVELATATYNQYGNVCIKRSTYYRMKRKDIFGDHKITESKRVAESEPECVIVWRVG